MITRGLCFDKSTKMADHTQKPDVTKLAAGCMHAVAELLKFCGFYLTRGQSNLTKSASRGAHSPVRGHPRGSKVVPLNSWGRVSY